MNSNTESKHIGQLIKEEVERQGLSAENFGEMICCERQNVYKIYKRSSLDTAQLGLISRALNHNFFVDIAHNEALSGVDDEKALQEIQNRMAIAQFVEVVPKVLSRIGIEPSIFFGRPMEIPEDVPLPEYFITPYNITFSVGELLYDKPGCNLIHTAKVSRVEDKNTGLKIDLWEFKVPGTQNLLNLKLDYKTEKQWEYTLRFVFKHYFSKYNIIKD